MNDPRTIAHDMKCPYCGGGVIFMPNDVIYRRSFGSGYAYICENFPKCDSFVGCHGEKANEDQRWMPLGTLADGELRSLRKRVHSLIDTYWRTPNVLSRGAVYRILRRLLDIPPDERAHVAMLDKVQCQKVLDGWEEALPAHLRNLFIMPQGIPDHGNET